MSDRNRQAPCCDDLGDLEAALDYRFRDRDLLERALLHSSAAGEQSLPSNQTMEFLGDAVVDLAVSDILFGMHPDSDEGGLTRIRAALVSARGLSHVARGLDLGRWLRLGRGEERSGGRSKAKILADSYEAIIAAVFLDAGYETARRVVKHTLGEDLGRANPAGCDYKTALQELTQELYRTTPRYAVVAMTGPDHARRFEVEIRLGGEVIARGDGPNRKSAEQMAARIAVESLQGNTPVE